MISMTGVQFKPGLRKFEIRADRGAGDLHCDGGHVLGLCDLPNLCPSERLASR